MNTNQASKLRGMHIKVPIDLYAFLRKAYYEQARSMSQIIIEEVEHLRKKIEKRLDKKI